MIKEIVDKNGAVVNRIVFDGKCKVFLEQLKKDGLTLRDAK